MGRMKLEIREIRVFNVLISRAVRNRVWIVETVTLEQLAECHMPGVR